jgi:predicted double-glycine peptidase
MGPLAVLISRAVLAAAAAFALFGQDGVVRRAAAEELLLADVGGSAYRPRVESYAERRFRTTIRQRYDFSCGSAALATLLTYHYGRPTSEVDIFREMFAQADQAVIQREGFSLLDMQQALARRGLHANGYRAPLTLLNEARIPAITLINSSGYSHFVVIKGLRDGRILLADPNLGTRAVDQATFEREWNGVLFVVLDDEQLGQASFNREQDWSTQPRAPLDLARDVTRNLGPLMLGWRDSHIF